MDSKKKDMSKSTMFKENIIINTFEESEWLELVQEVQVWVNKPSQKSQFPKWDPFFYEHELIPIYESTGFSLSSRLRF